MPKEITDTERLDWIERNSYGLRARRGGRHNLIVWNTFDLRSIIDCAMKYGVVMQKGGREKIEYRATKPLSCYMKPGRYAPTWKPK